MIVWEMWWETKQSSKISRKKTEIILEVSQGTKEEPYLDVLPFQNSSDWNGIFVILDTATIYTEIFPANKVSRSRHKKGIRV